MARITHNDLAPSEVVHYDLSGVEFELGGSGKASFETDDRNVLANASVHPWLNVEYDKVALVAGEPRRTLADRPDLDPMSGVGPNAGVAFDPEEIRKVEEPKREMDLNRLAIDAQLDQNEAQSVGNPDTGEVAVTLAADDTHEPAKSAKAFEQTDEEANAAASGEGMPERTTRRAANKEND